MNKVQPNHQQHRRLLQSIARRAMFEHDLLPDLSPAALAELKKIQTAAPNNETVRDLRSLLWASIDNDDSRDLDQLSVAETMPAGKVKILVAIADVVSSVKNGSAIDEHARHNTTSVYTAAQIFPMLPEKLSTDVTSLNFNQDRIAIVIEMVVGADGSIEDSKIYKSWVRNHAKLAYNSVAAWLERKADMQDEQLRPFYEALGKQREIPARAAAISDFLKRPALEGLDLAEYPARSGTRSISWPATMAAWSRRRLRSEMGTGPYSKAARRSRWMRIRVTGCTTPRAPSRVAPLLRSM
jgi:RNB domain